MKSLQEEFADAIRARLFSLRVQAVGLLDTPLARGADEITCGIAVTGAIFRPKAQSPEAPVITTTSLAVDVAFGPKVARAQEIKNSVYRYFVDEWHGMTGSLGDYEVQAMLLTGYSQSIMEGTDLGVESYGFQVQHTHEPRGG